MRLMITGGAGFIGSAVCREIARDASYFVLNVDKLTYAGDIRSLKSIEQNENYAFAKVDVCDQQAILELLRRYDIDIIMHLAAESHVDRSIDGPDTFIHTNVFGTFSMLMAARTYFDGLTDERKRSRFRFHHVSTDEVFGDLAFDGGLFTEESPYAPSSPYSASKAASDHLVRAWHETYGLPVVLSNCSNNYGPYQFPEKLIPLMILNALEGKELPVYGNGANVRDWLHVEDHARALQCIATSGRTGESYNIGADCERRNIDVVKTICSILDEKSPRKDGKSYSEQITMVEDRPGHDRRYAIDASKIKHELDWEPAESFQSGLENTIGWYMENKWWWEPIRKRGSSERLGIATVTK